MDDLLAKLPEADAFKSLSTLEAVRRELKARGGDAFLNNRLLLSALQRRLASARSPPTEEVAVAALLVLADFAGCMESDLVAGVPAVFAEAVPLLGQGSVRRAAGALLACLLRRGLGSAAEASVAQAIIGRGLRSDSVSSWWLLLPTTSPLGWESRSAPLPSSAPPLSCCPLRLRPSHTKTHHASPLSSSATLAPTLSSRSP
jgi:hypothetical protein